MIVQGPNEMIVQGPNENGENGENMHMRADSGGRRSWVLTVPQPACAGNPGAA